MDFTTGLKHYQEGNFDQAVAIFDHLIRVETGKAELYLYRGRTLTRLGKNEKALEDFDVLVSMEPYNTDFISDRGVVLHLMGRNEEALSELDRAANLDPKNPYRYSSRAFLKDRIGDLLGAIEDYEKAIELDPEDAVSFNNKGLVEEKLGYKERAKKSFDKADKLVGYTPKKETDNLPPIGSKNPNEMPKSSTVSDVEQRKMTSNHFWTTLKSLIGDQTVRAEFNRFVRGLFSEKKPKNS